MDNRCNGKSLQSHILIATRYNNQTSRQNNPTANKKQQAFGNTSELFAKEFFGNFSQKITMAVAHDAKGVSDNFVAIATKFFDCAGNGIHKNSSILKKNIQSLGCQVKTRNNPIFSVGS